MASKKYVYRFGVKTDGGAKMRVLLGGKGANLAEMARIGLPVPPGFTLTTQVCSYYYEHNRRYPKSLKAEVLKALKNLEGQTGRSFGVGEKPLLFSVRSGGRDSMPGMMDTILNLGLNDKTVVSLAKLSGERFAWDCYRRFIQMYGGVVLGIGAESEAEENPFEKQLSALKEKVKAQTDTDLGVDHLKSLVGLYKGLVLSRAGKAFPQDPYRQLWGAIAAVFNSWGNERAVLYRQRYHIPHHWGTAVNVQLMVFGNLGETSSTGVAFTRNPANGEKCLYGEYLINAQGEDVVAGARTPKPIEQLRKDMREVYAKLQKTRVILEKHFKDMQDFEFTVEDGKLYMLQTRNGKRTGLAAVRIACEMVKEKLIDHKEALIRVPADSIATLLVPIFDTSDIKKTKPIAQGLPAGPGAASGKIVFSASAAEAEGRQGRKVVLCRVETSPEDLRGMIAAEGILTSRGGVSSHAALVARQMGKVCICGAEALKIDYALKKLRVGNQVLREGDFISIDGTSGKVYQGALNTAASEVTQVLRGKKQAKKSVIYQMFLKIMKWADKERKMEIRVNADTPQQSKLALALGAEGIGLCRTEHMFFQGQRIDHMREMIIASNPSERKKALSKLIGYQRNDFKALFKAMAGKPVNIRLLDPPLHEFLPHEDASARALAEKLAVPVQLISDRIKSLREQNPMLGHRGCRLGISYPEITETQSTAIFEAAAACLKAKVKVKVEIMVPLVGFDKEFSLQANIIHAVAKKVSKAKGVKIPYKVGTMIEVPRAALRAESIAASAEFFSFGTNDLTQTSLGMSRDDAGSFLPTYQEKDIIAQDPFATIDIDGVGELVEIGTKRGRKGRENLKVGVCGEHGGDPRSIRFFKRAGLDYVSCSPNRLPVARLAAAQAELEG